MTSMSNAPSSLAWRRSSYSNGTGGECVEVADGAAGAVPVRDSKSPDGPVLVLAPSGWATFVSAVKAGHFEH